MIDLQPCARCDRHVASTEPACPFCGAAVAPASPRPPVRRGLSRAALFAGATLAASCGGGKPKADDPKTPPADAGVDARVEEPEQSDRIAPPDMPYGAPPARRRVV